MDHSVHARKRVALFGALATIVLFFVFPVLAVATPALDGVTGGIGVVYLIGIVEIVGATLAAVAYCRWADRAERG